MTILALNVGSSSVKFALYAEGVTGPEPRTRGQMDGVGGPSPLLKIQGEPATPSPDARSQAAALSAILDRLADAAPSIRAVGHRIVHGGDAFWAPVRLDAAVLQRLAAFEPLAPLHQPHNLAGVRAAAEALPHAVQIGCFDTGFHWGRPRVEDLFALPRRFYEEGVRRYGFHGLSYEYLAASLRERHPAEAEGRVILAHLGSGASMCALSGGRSIGSTMGFSALDGLPMGTRCGQLDPGVLLWMMAHKAMSPSEIEGVLYKESGLKGLSGVSGDLRAVEAAGTPEAEEAIAYFVSRARREIGGLAALLGGLDAIVFAGGIGENAARVRARLCEGLEFLGLRLDPAANAANAERISGAASRVSAFVIPTNEEVMIARHCMALMDSS